MTVKRVYPCNDILPINRDCYYTEQCRLPCSWIMHPAGTSEEPLVLGYRLSFRLEQAEKFTIHVSADQQYILYVDGLEAGRGSEMKSPENWYFESYELALEAGTHSLDALVWNWGSLSPANRMSLKAGFFLIPDEAHLALLGTGLAPWAVMRVRGIRFEGLHILPGSWMGVPPYQVTDYNELNWAPQEDRRGAAWEKPVTGEAGRNGRLYSCDGGHLLKPTPIQKWVHHEIRTMQVVYVADRMGAKGFVTPNANQADEAAFLNSRLNQAPILIPAHSQKRIIVKLDNYYCACSRLKVRQGKLARIRFGWVEALHMDAETPVKGNRDEYLGRYFRGIWDEMVLDGAEREIGPLAWRCGRYLELWIETGAESLYLDSLTLDETRYALEMDVKVSCDDPAVNAIVPLCFRTLQMAAHENFVDCPFYEQLLYSGDGRLEALVNLATARDDTLVRKAILMFDASRDNNGFTMARWPSRTRQMIPSFSLWWVGMVYDYALWRGDQPFIASFLPGVRFLLDQVMGRRDPDGFVRGCAGEWNFIDWVDEWHDGKHEWGAPPGISDSVNASYNWLFVYILGLAKKLEDYAGDNFLSGRWGKEAGDLSAKLIRRFWNSEKALFQEDDSGKYFSEHAQILAILSGQLQDQHIARLKKSLFGGERLPKCSIFYKHYLFEACKVLDCPEKILSEFKLWNAFLEKGFKTVPETPENKTFNQRSDCHGWGAHPIYHLIANLAGIKPSRMGFKEVAVSPRLAGLQALAAECIHPDGIVSLQAEKKGSEVSLVIRLPKTLSGTLTFDQHVAALAPGENVFHYGARGLN